MKILNVDDNDGGRYVKSRILQRAGFTVLEAATGEEAWQMVLTEQPDLVLLDVKLPDISGLEVCRRIKGHPATASIMVVQTSASFVEGHDRVRGLEEGADVYITEPVQPEELIATVKALLRLHQAEVELRQSRDTLEIRVQERTAELQRAIEALRQENARGARSEKALQTAYQFLQSILDALSSHIAILDETGSILDINASWQHFLGADGSTLASRCRGMAFGEFFITITGADAVTTQAVVTGVHEVMLQQRDTFSCEYAHQRQDGILWFFVRVTRFDSADGRYIVVVLENVTEVKRAEEALRHQQEALYQSEKLATMGAMLASVAHELNNPLAVVQMQLDLLAEEAPVSTIQEPLIELRRATERCVRIVQSFLTLVRHGPLPRTPVQLNNVVEAALQILGHTLELDQVVVCRSLAADLPCIGADATQLQQVVVNLLLNAQQALHETSSPRQVTLTTRYEATHNRVIIEVADTGPGIASSLQTRIFEPFFTTKTLGLGTGLGLSVCRGIVEGHGGSLSVVSEPGYGAMFRVALPVDAALLPETPEPEVQSPPVAIAASILIVDDEVSIAHGLARLLRRDGHRVETAVNGRQALTMLQEQEYDLILCDLRMPDLDGPGLYGAVAASQPSLLPRFIFLTGDTLSLEAKTFLDQAGVPHLIKPFSAGEGRRVVRQALHTLR